MGEDDGGYWGLQGYRETTPGVGAWRAKWEMQKVSWGWQKEGGADRMGLEAEV